MIPNVLNFISFHSSRPTTTRTCTSLLSAADNTTRGPWSGWFRKHTHREADGATVGVLLAWAPLNSEKLFEFDQQGKNNQEKPRKKSREMSRMWTICFKFTNKIRPFLPPAPRIFRSVRGEGLTYAHTRGCPLCAKLRCGVISTRSRDSFVMELTSKRETKMVALLFVCF